MLNKYQHNTGTTDCNLCSNFPETYLPFLSNKVTCPPLPAFVKVVLEIIQKNQIFQCFAPWRALLIFQPCCGTDFREILHDKLK